MSLQAGIRVLTLLSAGVALLTPAFCQTRGNPRTTAWRLSGHVTFEDGTVPKQSVYIESVCTGNVRKEATIDANGGFGFTLGQGNGDNVMNASNAHAGAGAQLDVAECVIRAALVGYTSDVVSMAGREEHKPDLGTLVLHKNGAGRPDSATTRKAPKAARQAFDKGVQAAKDNQPDNAAMNFQQAVTLYPGFAEAWNELGRMQMLLKQVDQARKSFNMALEADEKFIPPYLQLAALESGVANWKAVVDVTDRMLKLAPSGYPQIYLVNGMANFRLQNLDAAEKSARAGIEIDRQYQAPRLYDVLASVLNARGDFAGAAAQFRKYLEIAPTAGDAPRIKAQIAELESHAAASGK